MKSWQRLLLSFCLLVILGVLLVDAQSIIGRHDWRWKNLLPPKGPVTLITAADMWVELFEQ